MGSGGPWQSGPLCLAGLSSLLAGKERAVQSSRAWMSGAVHATHLSVPGSSVGLGEPVEFPVVPSTLMGPVYCWCLCVVGEWEPLFSPLPWDPGGDQEPCGIIRLFLGGPGSTEFQGCFLQIIDLECLLLRGVWQVYSVPLRFWMKFSWDSWKQGAARVRYLVVSEMVRAKAT